MRRRWSRISKVYVLLSMASGLAAFGLVRGYAARLDALRPVVGSPIPVVVAAQALSRGTQLTASMFRVSSVPSAFAPPGALRAPSQAEGRTLTSDLAAGEALTRTRLGAEGAGPVASLVPPGLRAFAVPSAMPPGSVRAGDRVDVLATFGGGRPHTETVATGLQVLMVLRAGYDAGPTAVAGTSAAGPSLVVLASPDEVEQLAYARAFAQLAVAIVSAGDAAAP